MGKPTELTRKMLEDWGVTYISPDGHVFVDGHERRVIVQKKPSRYKIQKYHTFTIYDKELYNKQKEKGQKAIGQRTVVLSRAIWAWHNGECPANLDVDHINNDSLDDRLENYQLLTRAENLAKRHGHRNQYAKS